MATLFGMFPFLQKLFADGGYQGPEFNRALARVLPHLKAAIVKRSDRAKGFVACPNAGSSNALSLGSFTVAGSSRTGRTSIEKRSHSCASPQSASCSEDFVIPHKVTPPHRAHDVLDDVRAGERTPQFRRLAELREVTIWSSPSRIEAETRSPFRGAGKVAKKRLGLAGVVHLTGLPQCAPRLGVHRFRQAV
jgi:hypothetical protein